MMCGQCGAPMVLVREKDYYFCEYCGAHHFPNPSEEGIRSLGKDPARIKCPLCQEPFNIISLDDHYRGHQCPNCQGILFHRGTFRTTLENRRARATTPPEPPTRPKDEELERRVHCPKCTQAMETYRYMGPGNIIIDTCNSCDLIWLDYGELGNAVNAPGKDRGIGQKAQIEKRWKESQKMGKKKLKLDVDLLDLFGDLLP